MSNSLARWPWRIGTAVWFIEKQDVRRSRVIGGFVVRFASLRRGRATQIVVRASCNRIRFFDRMYLFPSAEDAERQLALDALAGQ